MRNVRLIVIGLVLYVLSVIGYSIYSYEETKRTTYQTLDKQLKLAAHGIANILQKDFHDLVKRKEDLGKEAYLQILDRLTEWSAVVETKYVYALIKRDGQAYWTASSYDKTKANDRETTYETLFQPYREASAGLLRLFEEPRLLFEEGSDRWGTFRSILIPLRSPKGVPFVVGADIEITHLRRLLRRNLIQSISIGLFFLLLITPFTVAYIIRLQRYWDAWNAEENARLAIQQAASIARQYQALLNPMSTPPLLEASDVELAGTVTPADDVGGDFYDYFFVNPTSLVLLVADVSDRGIPASQFMALARTLTKGFCLEGYQPGEVLGKVNGVLAHDNPSAMFATLMLVQCDVTTGACAYASAGSPGAVLLRADGGSEVLGNHRGVALGILPELSYAEGAFLLAPGDTLLLFTDGVTEATAPDHSPFGEERLISLLRAHESADPAVLCGALLKAVSEYQKGKLGDDMTLLVARRKKSAQSQALVSSGDAATPAKTPLITDSSPAGQGAPG